MLKYNWMIKWTSLGKILGIFFHLKAFGLLQTTFKMRTLFFKATFWVPVGRFDYFLPPPPCENQNPNNCRVIKSISEISVYVMRVASCSSYGAEKIRNGIQFCRHSAAGAMILPFLFLQSCQSLSLCVCSSSAAAEAVGICFVHHTPPSHLSAMSCGV